MGLTMIEALISTKQEDRIIADPIFLYDPATGTDLTGKTAYTETRYSGTTVDNSVLIDGHPTILLASTSHGVNGTFTNGLNLDLPEWTIEWSTIPASLPVNTYRNELWINNANYHIGNRWTDTGFGDRMQHFASTAAINTQMWRSIGKATAQGVLNRWAMVKVGTQVYVYHNGQRMTMTAGTAGTPGGTADNFAWGGPMGLLTTLTYGYRNSTQAAFLGNLGRIRITPSARYLGNYTPQPF